MKKANLIALAAMFMTVSVTFATVDVRAFAQDDPVLDCWSTQEKMEDGEAPDVSIVRDCPDGNVICCYDETGSYFKTTP